MSGKDCTAALERNPAVLIGDTNCPVDWYFPAPEDVEDLKDRQRSKHRDQGRKRNRGGGYGGGYGDGFRGHKERGRGGGRFGGYEHKYMAKQDHMNQMLMSQMQNLATMVQGGGGGGGSGYGGPGYGDYEYDQGFGDNFGGYQSGYYDDDYSAPNKRMKGNRGNRRGGGGFGW